MNAANVSIVSFKPSLAEMQEMMISEPVRFFPFRYCGATDLNLSVCKAGEKLTQGSGDVEVTFWKAKSRSNKMQKPTMIMVGDPMVGKVALMKQVSTFSLVQANLHLRRRSIYTNRRTRHIHQQKIRVLWGRRSRSIKEESRSAFRW